MVRSVPARVGAAVAAWVAVGLVATGCLPDAADSGGAPEDGPSRTVVVLRVVDGDTVEIASGAHVRMIGIDTPERGDCGYEEATSALRRMVEGRKVVLVDPASVQGRDTYGRRLRFVDVAGRDAGLAQLRAGWATARYDSRDGYDPHPREDRYRATDRQHDSAC
jgi:endonuclease YncB( thermonuclease family)